MDYYQYFQPAEERKPLPKPYNKLKKLLPPKHHGWLQEENREELRKMIQERQVKTIFELGAWFGVSTLFMASLLPKEGKIYAIDHWQGSKEHKEEYAFLLPNLYEHFLCNVIHAGYVYKIVPIKKTTLQAAKLLTKVKPDLIYVDASHDTESVYQDLCAYYPYIQKRGILCGDDWDWGEKKENGMYNVEEGVIKFCKKRSLSYRINGCFWEIIH